MKVLVVLLVCSLAANAAYLIVRGFPSSPDSPAPASAAAAETPVSPEVQREAIAAFFDHKRTDATTLTTQLEAAGFPPEIARAAAVAQVQHEFNQRQLAVIGEIETPPFWKTTTTLSPTSNLTPEQQRELALLRKERDLRMKDLIAGSVEAGAAESIAARQRWGPVPAEKVAAVHRIEADYAELRREIVANRSPLNLPAAEMEKLALLNRERRADIERTLTPDELFEYDLRQSPTASQLRSQLSSFRPTEDEFRAIFRVQHALDTASGRFAAYAGSMTISSSDRDETREAQLTHLKSILPPERYADFEFATNSANSSLARVANRFRVPLSSAREVATIRDATLKEIAKVREDSSNPPAVRDARTAELTLAAAERVSGALGPDAYRAYLENGGSWLTPRLPAAQRPAPSAP